MAKRTNSKRNRHTGRINAFKQNILDRGREVEVGTTKYKSLGEKVIKHPVLQIPIMLHGGTHVRAA